MRSALGDGRDASKFDKLAHKVELREFLKELNSNAKDIRKFAKEEGVQALWVRVLHKEAKVSRLAVISELAIGTGVTLIDPLKDERFKALRHASKVRTLHDEKKEQGKVTGERYLFWVKNEECGNLHGRVAALNETEEWYTAWITVRVGDTTHTAEIMRDPLAGTEGTLAGYIQGLDWARALQGADSEDILGKAAKLTGIFQAQMVTQGLMKGPSDRIPAKIMKRKVVGNDAYAWTVMVAEEDAEVRECLKKFNWHLFQGEVGAKRTVAFYTQAPEYMHQVEVGRKAREEHTKSRSDPEVEDRTVVVFGSKKSQSEIEGVRDKLEGMVKLALTSCDFKEEDIDVDITVFTSRAGNAVVKVLLGTAEQAKLVAVEQMGFKAVLGERAMARISEVAQGAAGQQMEPKPTYRQAAQQATGNAGDMERKMEIVAKRQMEGIAVAIREGVRAEILAQAELEKQARESGLAWMKDQYSSALKESEERTDKRLVVAEKNSGAALTEMSTMFQGMRTMMTQMAEATARMEKMFPGAASAHQQPIPAVPVQEGADPARDGKGMSGGDDDSAGMEDGAKKRERSLTMDGAAEVASGRRELEGTEGQEPPSSVQKPAAGSREDVAVQGEKKMRVDDTDGDTDMGGHGQSDDQ